MQKKLKVKLSVYGELVKYKLSIAVSVSAGTGYLLYQNAPALGIIPLLCGVFMLAAGAAALNQYTERNIDAIMERTCRRPLPSRRVTLREARSVFIFLITTGSILLLLKGIIPFFIGLLNVLLYNLIYTSLKKKSALSIIPGALVGAIPPLIGYTSAGGTVLNTKILLFASFMFLWQVPHFWLLLIRHGKEYRKAGIVTISDYLDDTQIKKITFFWILLTSVVLLFFSGFSDIFSSYFLFTVLILNPFFIFFFYRLLFSPKTYNNLKGAFILLNVFSVLIMLLLAADSVFQGL
jgi:protoheme IX farnesyltransferase